MNPFQPMNEVILSGRSFVGGSQFVRVKDSSDGGRLSVPELRGWNFFFDGIDQPPCFFLVVSLQRAGRAAGKFSVTALRH